MATATTSVKKPPFKVGDYVMALSESFGWGDVTAGDVGIVTGVIVSSRPHPLDYYYEVKFLTQEGWNCFAPDLALATPQQKADAQVRLSRAAIMRSSISLGASKTPIKPRLQRAPRKPKHLKDAQEGDHFKIVDTSSDDHGFSQGQIVIFERLALQDEERRYIAKCWNLDKDDYFWVIADNLVPSTAGKVSFDSVILSDDKKQKIMATIKQVDNHELIFTHWGFGDVLEKGKAISMLFYGPPGTGKTLMAQAIADKYNKKLKIIGSAEIESSEPGQAERNIKAYFENTDKHTVLLFDECDSLVYSREHVGSILAAQVNQLLSSLETYEGIVIFTTNRLGVLDEAFNRRLSLKLEFDLPNHAERVKIWQRMIPQKAPLADDVDFEALAQVEMSGGYIKNVVLRAARMAANEDIKDKDKKITMKHLVDALTDEVESVIEFDDARSLNHTPRIAGSGGISRSSSVRRTVERGATTS